VPNFGLDLPGGAKLAAAEMYGDWYRDPWGWPELFPAAVSSLDAADDLHVGLRDGGEHHLQVQPFFHLIDVPKTRLGVRPAVVQDPLSRLAYLSAVHSGLPKLNADLPDWVYGWRMRSGNAVASGGSEWSAYVETLPTREQPGFGLLTDITSFFASIRPERLEPIVYGRLGRVTAAHIIMDVVAAHDSLSTRSGLPQRSFASAVLAHAVLQPVDDALAAAAASGRTTVRRWMDDVSAEGDESALFALLMDLQERARQVGLELNASKTHLSPVAETADTLRLEDLREIKVPMTAVLGGAYQEPLFFEPDLEVLHGLESWALNNPTKVSRTVAKAILVSLTNNDEFSRYREWQGSARALPHAADSLGRYLRRAAEQGVASWGELGNWFSEYQASVWGRLDWVSSQFGLVFPANHIPGPVATVFQNWLKASSNLQQIAIAVQRLCTIAPVVSRNLIRARLDRTADPLLLRVFALGLLLAGDNRAAVKDVLVRDRRNHLLVRRLEQTNWQAPHVSKDFDLSSTDVENPQEKPACDEPHPGKPG